LEVLVDIGVCRLSIPKTSKSVRGELVEPHLHQKSATYKLPFDKLRANGGFLEVPVLVEKGNKTYKTELLIEGTLVKSLKVVIPSSKSQLIRQAQSEPIPCLAVYRDDVIN
jgi:hypothetical protein